MEYYAGIDVSLESSSVCVVDGSGRIIREAKVGSEPAALLAWFKGLEFDLARIGLEAGPLSQWLYASMHDAGLMSNGVTHGLDLHTVAKREFLEKFESTVLLPRDLPHRVMFTGPTGTNAVEAAMKIARRATGRVRIGAFTNGFHGVSAGSLAATGNRFHRRVGDIAHSAIDRFPYDGYFGPDIDTVAMMERLLEDPSSGFEPPAAFLLECVQAEGGLNVANEDWLRRLSFLASRLGCLLIIDDIQAGCGRTGTFFSFEGSGIKPDIICLSKGISAYGLPMSIVLVSPEHDVLEPGQHNGTFRGHNPAFVTAAAGLEFWDAPEFGDVIAANAFRFKAAISAIAETMGAEYIVKGKGLMLGLACPSQEIAKAISQAAFRNGLIVETCGPNDEVVKVLPPLNIDSAVAEEGLLILCEAAGSCRDM